MATQLPPDGFSNDFTKESLIQNSNLCLAQAQYLFFKKATDAGMNASVLSKIAAQVAIYFQKAFDNNQVNAALRSFDNRKFANVLGYHSKYFLAQSYWHLGSAQYKTAEDEGRGMNKAVAYLTVCVQKFTEAKPFAEQCGGPYKSNFDAKFTEAQRMLAKATDDNKKIYYEPRVPIEELPAVDPQNFASMASMEAEINERAALDDKLRHVVPPAVRALQDELKNTLQQIIQTEFSKVAEKDEQMLGFLKQFGLPQVLHSITSSTDVPDDIWLKIEEFQKKGAAQNFAQAIQGTESLKQMNTEVLGVCKQTLDAEENEDTQLRNQYQQRFNRPPSSTVNQQYKQQLFEYQQKLDMAVATDTQIKSMFERNT